MWPHPGQDKRGSQRDPWTFRRPLGGRRGTAPGPEWERPSPLGMFLAFGAELRAGGGSSMLTLGLMLLILGFLTDSGILVTLGIILLVGGAVLWMLGSMASGRRPSGTTGSSDASLVDAAVTIVAGLLNYAGSTRRSNATCPNPFK